MLRGLVPPDLAPQLVGGQFIQFHVGYAAVVAQTLASTLILTVFLWSLRGVRAELR